MIPPTNEVSALCALSFPRQLTELVETNFIDPNRLPADRLHVLTDPPENMKDTVLPSMKHVIMEEPDAVGTSCDVGKTSELTRIHDRIMVSSLATHVAAQLGDFCMDPLGFHVNHLDSPCSHVAELPTALDAC